MKMSSAHLHRRLVSLTALLAFTAVNGGAVQAAAVKKPLSSHATRSVRNLQPERVVQLDDGKRITITFTSEKLCSARINDGSFFGTAACSCFMLCPSDIVSYDCGNHSDDPCAKVECSGLCKDGSEAEVTFNTDLAPEGPDPTASPTASPMAAEGPADPTVSPVMFEPEPDPTVSPNAVEEEPAPSASPVEAESPSAGPVVAPSAGPVEAESPSASPVVAPTASPVEEEAPSASPVEDEAPSASPEVAPSASPVDSSMEAPSSSPESDNGESPIASPVQVPTSSPVDLPGVPAPTSAPTFSLAPFANKTMAPECAMNSACADLNLTGTCCPTMAGWILDCCDDAGPVEETCELNPKCDELGLKGACCPTNDGFGYLNCCSPLPDECIDSDSCNVTSATDYLEFIQERDGAAALNDSGAASLATTAMILLISTVATLGLLI